MNVSWNILISTLIMLRAGHTSQDMTLTTVLIYCQGLECVDLHLHAPYAFNLCTEITLPSPCLIFLNCLKNPVIMYALYMYVPVSFPWFRILSWSFLNTMLESWFL